MWCFQVACLSFQILFFFFLLLHLFSRMSFNAAVWIHPGIHQEKMQANGPLVRRFWQLPSLASPSSLSSNIKLLFFFVSIIIHSLQLLWTQTRLPKSCCRKAREAKRQLILCWSDGIRRSVIEYGLTGDVGVLIFIWLERLSLAPWLRGGGWEGLEMEDGRWKTARKQNRWLNLSTVSASISRCPGLIKAAFIPRTC